MTLPGMAEHIAEFTSEKAWGKEGYWSDAGLTAMPDAQRKAKAAKAKDLPNLKQ